MSLKEWWNWFKSLHITRKWFLVLILLRPVIDNFYNLKEVSVLASPLYIVGALTPVFILMSFASNKFPRRLRAGQDVFWSVFSVFLAVNCFIFYALELSVVAFGDLIKYTTPILLWYYSRSFIQNRRDLHGILTTFLVSALFPMGMMVYEAYNPIAVQYIGAGRGGGARIRGGYGDIMNYAVYIVGVFMIMCYYFLINVYSRIRFKFRLKPWHMMMVLAFVIYALTQIKHVSTWSVTTALTVIFMLHNLKNMRGALFVIAALSILLPFVLQDLYKAQIEPLIAKELLVAEGETESDQALNGRMTRWEKYFEIWEQMPPVNHFIGIASANFPETIIMIGAGMHSDYVRLLFLVGFIGLAFYILFILSVATNYFRLRMAEKYLLCATVAAILLWSVSTIPLLYAPLLYIAFPIFAYSVMPSSRQYQDA
jgi:hypothetical protein